MPFLTRYVDDDHRPSFGEAGRDLLLRAVAPAVLLYGAIVGFGLLLKGPLKGLAASEESVNKSLNAWEQVRSFLIIDTPPTIESGEITPTLKVRRYAVEAKYKRKIDAFYET
jgi:hypothetical protein